MVPLGKVSYQRVELDGLVHHGGVHILDRVAGTMQVRNEALVILRG